MIAVILYSGINTELFSASTASLQQILYSLVVRPVIVGVCKIKLRIPHNSSLKGKRRVVKSIIAQLKNRFNVAVAEVDDQELWQVATLGVCCVSNDSRYTNEVLSKAVNFVADGRFEAEIIDYEIEIIPC